MATNSAPPKLQNDVDTIRAILFGEQSSEFQERITTLETLVAALQEENKQLKKALDKEASTRENHESEANTLLETTKASILDQMSRLGAKLGSQSDTDREKFSQALDNQKTSFDSQMQDLRGEFVATIQAHQLKQDALIDALAKALLAYQTGS